MVDKELLKEFSKRDLLLGNTTYDFVSLGYYLSMELTPNDIAEIYDCSVSYIYKLIKEKYNECWNSIKKRYKEEI